MTKNSTAAVQIVPFRRAELLLVDHDGKPFVPMRPVVQGMGLDWKSQHTKLSAGRFSTCMVEITTQLPGDTQRRAVACLPLRKLPGWLMSIHPNKVREELRDGIIAYQNECDDVLWAYWNEGVAVRNDDRTVETVLNSTIGTDGFHMLGALIKGKVASLPVAAQRRATAKLWSQTHAAFGVRSAADIPADQLDAARNFIAAYAIEGEWICKEPESGRLLTDMQLYDVWFVAHHFERLYEIFKRSNLHVHLGGLGSRIGSDMAGHFLDGYTAVIKLKKLAPEFDAAQRRLKLNRYSENRGVAA